MTNPPEVKGVTPKRIFQKIESERLFEVDLDFEPSYVPWIYLENVIQRVLARMVGQGPFGPVTVKCTKDGSLAVVSRGGAFDAYERLDKSFSSIVDSTTDGTTADKLVDSAVDFVTLDIAVGDSVCNRTDKTTALVTAIDDLNTLSLDADIMITGETYSIIRPYEFEFSQQMSRIDLFTYNGLIDYQLTRDNIQPYGDKIELFEDSFYSLDFFCLKAKATPTTWDTTSHTKSKLMGWYRLDE
uniref:Uncharacterized protein n=1 Tax=viral metagenome TaxID=1070528 RepID=A0A6M3LKS1_9ZZZZ